MDVRCFYAVSSNILRFLYSDAIFGVNHLGCSRIYISGLVSLYFVACTILSAVMRNMGI